MPFFEPVYLKTHQKGILQEKIALATTILKDCILCPRACHVNRLAEQKGMCKTGKNAWVSSYSPHFGEEAPLVGQHGSGTIFFTHCNLLCNFCQNFDISHEGAGMEINGIHLARMMLALQHRGCHNINFVTPSHVVPQILSALDIAIEGGLSIPLVYNSSGYDQVDTLKILDGVIDIYMPDFKFWEPEVAKRTCNAPDYPEVARNAIAEMHRQVGDLVLDESGIAQHGLLLRHLVMPNGMADTRDVMHWIATELSPDTYVNVMSQYRPCGKAHDIPELAARLTEREFQMALQDAQKEGLTRLDKPSRSFLF